MKTVILTTDFSPHARHAIDYALNLFEGFGDEPIQYQLVNTFQPVNTMAAISHTPALDNSEQLEKSESKFLEVVRQLAVKVDLKPIFEIGEFSAIITRIESQENIDLIVMGCHDESRTKLLLSGSETSHLVDKCSSPILMVPKTAPIKFPQRIAMAADYEPLSVAWESFKLFKDLADHCQAKLTIFHVFKSGQTDAHEKAMNESALHRYLENTEHEHIAIVDKNPANGIARFAQEYKPDLLVVLPRERNFFKKLFHKSIVKHLAHHTKIPMLVLK
jgi:nucleotide-binding universal stress UspA family protein